MTPSEIIQELRSMNNYSIHFNDDGTITAKFGKNTYNIYAVINDRLVCIDCKTRY